MPSSDSDAYLEYIARKRAAEPQAAKSRSGLPPRVQGLLWICPGSLIAGLAGTLNTPAVGIPCFLWALAHGVWMVITGRSGSNFSADDRPLMQHYTWNAHTQRYDIPVKPVSPPPPCYCAYGREYCPTHRGY